MEVKLVHAPASAIEADALVVLEWEGTESADSFSELRQSGEITGKLLEFTLLHALAGYKARRVLVAGAGKRDKFDSTSLRKIAGAAVRFLKPKGIASIAFAVDENPESVSAVADAAILGAWEPDYLKTDLEGKNKAIASITIAATG